MPQPDPWMALDDTLTQFTSVLELAIPPIIGLPWTKAQGRYGYCVDGAYHNHTTRNDIRNDLVEPITRPA